MAGSEGRNKRLRMDMGGWSRKMRVGEDDVRKQDVPQGTNTGLRFMTSRRLVCVRVCLGSEAGCASGWRTPLRFATCGSRVCLRVRWSGCTILCGKWVRLTTWKTWVCLRVSTHSSEVQHGGSRCTSR